MSIRMKGVALCLALVCGFGMKAQEYLHQVFVLNEGWSDWQTGEVLIPPTLGVYDPGLQVYSVVQEIEGVGFISDAIISDGALFVAADNQLLKFDIDTFDLLASTEVIGVRQLAVQNGMIYVTRGEVDDFGMNLPLNSYLQWFEIENLMWMGELTTEDGPSYATEGISWLNGNLFIGINNAFDWGNEVGLIGEWNPTTNTYIEFDLGENGKNPYHLFMTNDQLVTVNNRDYGSVSLSSLDPSNGQVQTYVVNDAASGCLAAAMDGTTLKFQLSGEDAVRVASLSDLENSSSWLTNAPEYYGVAIDPVSGHWYGSVTDYTTFGLVEIRNEEGEVVGSFDCGVSPGVICMDVRNVSEITTIQELMSPMAPNAYFNVSGQSVLNEINACGMIIDASGNKIIRLGLE